MERTKKGERVYFWNKIVRRFKTDNHHPEMPLALCTEPMHTNNAAESRWLSLK